MNRQEFLNQVGQIVSSDRQATHGKPEDNFKPIADMWTTYLSKKYNARIVVTSIDVAWLMILLKVVRAAGNPSNVDNPIDVAGYAACLAPLLSVPVQPKTLDEDTIKEVMDSLIKTMPKTPSYGPIVMPLTQPVIGDYPAPVVTCESTGVDQLDILNRIVRHLESGNAANSKPV